MLSISEINGWDYEVRVVLKSIPYPYPFNMQPEIYQIKPKTFFIFYSIYSLSWSQINSAVVIGVTEPRKIVRRPWQNASFFIQHNVNNISLKANFKNHKYSLKSFYP